MEVYRVKLRNWLKLAKIREDILETKSDVGNRILEYLEVCSNISEEEKRLPWSEIGEVFFQAVQENDININFPILRVKQNKTQQQEAWEYPEREWYYWLHLFAGAYGWDQDKVAELDINDAIGLMQEIELEKQFDREWDHGLSELSYAYDKASKKSRYVPLKRPVWMNSIPDVKKLIRKIPKKLIPPGVVIKTNEDTTINDS